jgi:glycosyltransferase involved in cell wall biosynthesis
MIVYVASGRSYSSRAPGRKIVSICKTWRARGHSVELVCGADVPGADVSGADGLDVEVAKKKPSRRFTSRPRQRGLHMPAVHSASEYRDIRHDRLLKAHLLARIGTARPKLIWHRASRLHLAPLLVAHELGIPYVLEWIDELVSYKVSLFRWKALAADRRRLGEALRVVVVSKVWARELANEYGIPLERFLVAHNAVRSAEFTHDGGAAARIREELGIPGDAFVVGFVGSYDWFHEADMVPRAAAKLRGRVERPVYWLMVGDGPGRAKVDALARELSVEDMVPRRGIIPYKEVGGWLSAMDAGLSMSRSEIICPIKVPEYMAAGLVPVVADTAANREVVQPGRTGVLFRPGDVDSLAEQVAELSAVPARVRELGDAARLEAAARFSWDTTWGQALDEVLSL